MGIERARSAADGVDLILVRHDRSFERPNPYVDPATGKDWPDNAARFILFSKAIIEGLILLDFAPDVIHLNDYQTGLVPILLREVYGDREDLARAGVVYAIHNMGYQGIYPPEVLEEIGPDFDERFFQPMGPLEFWGKVNFMKAAILYADLVTTVSERYAEEIQSAEEFGFGLEGVLRTRTSDLIGILNGIDTEIWNPATDPSDSTQLRALRLRPETREQAALAPGDGTAGGEGRPGDRDDLAARRAEGVRSCRRGERASYGAGREARRPRERAAPVRGHDEEAPQGSPHEGRGESDVQQPTGAPDRGGERLLPDAVTVRALRPEPDVLASATAPCRSSGRPADWRTPCVPTTPRPVAGTDSCSRSTPQRRCSPRSTRRLPHTVGSDRGRSS